jgi:hypothetical protein
MFIATVPRQDSSPQRGDMFIELALGAQFSLPTSTNANVCLNFSLVQINWPKHVHPARVKSHLIGPPKL